MIISLPLEILKNSSRTTASTIIPIIGPRIIALGAMDFIIAAIIPARIIRPFCGQRVIKARIKITLKNDITVPLNGIRILCRKLPRTISLAAQRLPNAAAFNQRLFNLFSTLGCIILRFVKCVVQRQNVIIEDLY